MNAALLDTALIRRRTPDCGDSEDDALARTGYSTEWLGVLRRAGVAEGALPMLHKDVEHALIYIGNVKNGGFFQVLDNHCRDWPEMAVALDRLMRACGARHHLKILDEQKALLARQPREVLDALGKRNDLLVVEQVGGETRYRGLWDPKDDAGFAALESRFYALDSAQFRRARPDVAVPAAPESLTVLIARHLDAKGAYSVVSEDEYARVIAEITGRMETQ